MTRRRFLRALIYLALALVGGIVAWRVAPDVDGWFFPVLTDVYLMPFDPEHSQALFSQQLDRICWRQHAHKTRDAEAYRWLVTIVGNDGTRYFSEPIDARTGESFSNRNSRPAGSDVTPAYCAILPDGFDATEGFHVDNYLQYLPKHHLWIIEQEYLDFDVPPMGEVQ